MPSDPTVRLALWSGPRNISTAMMRAWENRPDTEVVDEPFYAAYLARTGKLHPGREAVLAAQPTDPAEVVRRLFASPRPDASGRSPRILYQKHMAHHLPEGFERDSLAGLRHGFLLREPAAMLLSLDRVTPGPEVEDTGLPRQLELFRAFESASAGPPPVLDSSDVLADPEAALRALCSAWDVPFDQAMLSWPAGPRASDGVWAQHWYASVEASTGFGPPPAPRSAQELPERLRRVHDTCLPFYEELHDQRLRF